MNYLDFNFRQLRHEQEMENIKREITEEIEQNLRDDQKHLEEKSSEVRQAIVSQFPNDLFFCRNARLPLLLWRTWINVLAKCSKNLSFLIMQLI